MVYILNIETSTKNCSVALSQNGQLLLCKEMADQGYSHAEKLHVFIEEILAETSISFSQLSAIAISSGPGSYTGLRIGVSAAKGLSFAGNIPLISVDTLTSLAHQINIPDGFIIPMIDARRMEVYSAVFNSKKEMVRGVEAQIISEESFAEITDTVYFIGDSNEKVKSILNKPNHIFLDEHTYPSAQQMCELSYQKFLNNQLEDLAYYEPYYLKDFLFIKSTKSV